MLTTHRNSILLLSLIIGAALATPQSRAAENSYANSIGMEFVMIPAGTFLMGSDDRDRGAASNEMPRHEVTISKPFYLGKYEVTQAQWEAVMGQQSVHARQVEPIFQFAGHGGATDKAHQPRNGVLGGCAGVHQAPQPERGPHRYRLPTEAEWEYAARAETTTAYSFGDEPSQLGRYAWHGEDFASGSTHPVGQKEPNGWDLYDIHGNVWEWVQDWYGERYYANSPTLDPQGPQPGSSRVVRGGSWHQTATSWRSAFRRQYEPDYRGISIGFRLVLSLAE